MLRGLGHVPDVEDTRDLTTRHLAARLAGGASPTSWGPRAASSDLRVWQGRQTIDHVRDQKSSEACVGYAITRIAHMKAIIDGIPNAKHGAPFMVWKMALRAMLGKGIPFANMGTRPRDACAAVVAFGVANEDAVPSELADLEKEIDDVALRGASDYRGSSFYSVEEEFTARIERIEQLLTIGVPSAAAIEVDGPFSSWWATESAVMPDVDEATIRGLHYVPIIGHAPGKKLILNSWGDWGDHGYAWIPDSRIIRATDPRAMLVSPEAT